MNYTKYPEINKILDKLSKYIKRTLGDKLVGLYLYGSAVWGDFDDEISDIDLLAATSKVISKSDLIELEKMHKRISEEEKQWDNRVEVQYQSLEGLKTFRTKKTKMANISPGEPLHFLAAGKDWLMNWYFVQNYGVTILGEDPSKIIPPISEKEFLNKVKEDVNYWKTHIRKSIFSLPYQGFAIMTLSRALYTLKFHEQVSKRKAAAWVKREYPQWKTLIEKAFTWRKNFRSSQKGAKEQYTETEKFTFFVIKESEQF